VCRWCEDEHVKVEREPPEGGGVINGGQLVLETTMARMIDA
jgi:hypothetical protein